MRLIDADAIPYLLDHVAEKMVVTKSEIEEMPTYEVHKIEKSISVDSEELFYRGRQDEVISFVGNKMVHEMLGDIANYTELRSTTDYRTCLTTVKAIVLVLVPPENQK